jgi:hypothetical protein
LGGARRPSQQRLTGGRATRRTAAGAGQRHSPGPRRTIGRAIDGVGAAVHLERESGHGTSSARGAPASGMRGLLAGARSGVLPSHNPSVALTFPASGSRVPSGRVPSGRVPSGRVPSRESGDLH